MRTKISEFYHSTLGRFVECVGLFRLDIKKFNFEVDSTEERRYKFFIPKLGDIELLYQHVDNNKNQKVKERFEDGNYICFAYLDIEKNRIAYTRWVCFGAFYSAPFKRNMIFKKNECFTLDSYTLPDYRGLGLHRRMNVEMLQWLKKHTDYQYVYMVIKCFIPHLHKVVKDMGYIKIETKVYFKKGSLNQFFGIVRSKLIK
jgi:GNAT superfamily N-acetyltransferase